MEMQQAGADRAYHRRGGSSAGWEEIHRTSINVACAKRVAHVNLDWFVTIRGASAPICFFNVVFGINNSTVLGRKKINLSCAFVSCVGEKEKSRGDTS